MLLSEPTGAEAATYLEKERAATGYVMNLERAWGTRLAGMRGAAAVAAVLRGADPADATVREAALRRWAGQVVREPNGASASQVGQLRRAGLSDLEIFEATVQVAFRLAFSAVNDALGVRPDLELVADAPAEIRAAVTHGRMPDRRCGH